MDRKAKKPSLLLVSLLALQASSASGQPTEVSHPAERLTVLISDTHWGLGAGDPREDFKWRKALRGFLNYVSTEGGDSVDLVIVGDFLELWQRPRNLPCANSHDPDRGCTVREMKALTERVLAAHRYDVRTIEAFSQRGENHVYIIPGNHDAALLVPSIWATLANALGAESGRVTFEADGLWTSADGRVVAEHGHQIGSDANRYADWPQVTTRDGGKERMIQPWGERFVQKLFNADERNYPVIDNLSPRSAGARYRMADRGLWQSARDMARFVYFNVYETSVTQKVGFLGGSEAASTSGGFDRRKAKELGHKLIVDSLPKDDPLRKELQGPSDSAREIREALDQLVQGLGDDELAMLCEKAAKSGNPCKTTLGSVTEELIPRAEVLRTHLLRRIQDSQKMSVFVYGHTHAYETPWALKLSRERQVTITNTGAFQRLVDKDGFLRRTQGTTPAEGLRTMRLRDLAPCYSAVFVEYQRGRPTPSVVIWHMAENGRGERLSPGSSKCL